MKLKQIVVLCMAGILTLSSISGCGNTEKNTIQQEESKSKENKPKEKKPEGKESELEGGEEQKEHNQKSEQRSSDLECCIVTQIE